ncbi:MAG: glycerol-3-phosphate dehydrogenase subunit GlpB [Thermodesulfobacteriota bacterium]|nr:glycerol-3-phosphate dehydrogenase subunit GlpB [Thermodesulfobacteriota bacterium]
MCSEQTHDYDCIIIGGGISGLTCGIRCQSQGLSCAIISSGMSALHFSSGSIDLLGYLAGLDVVQQPFEILPEFIDRHPDHPYAKCGIDTTRTAFAFFQETLARQNLHLHTNTPNNHFHVTAFGTLKPTFFSQQSVFSQAIKSAFENHPAIIIANVRGFKDFHPQLAAANLRKNKLFAGCDISCAVIDLPEAHEPGVETIRNMRSIDIARIVDKQENLAIFAQRINATGHQADILALPACLGIDHYNRAILELSDQTGMTVYEVPSLPPSILGMRLDNALKARFAALGGVFIAGESVTSGRIQGNRVAYIHTRNQDEDLSARFYVLASGSFFSRGLASGFESIKEPVFDLEVLPGMENTEMASPAFFSPDSHAFMRAGVKTNARLNPFQKNGEPVTNLFCTGAVLADYNPVAEASGGGVAITTGYYAANNIDALVKSLIF